VRLNLDVIVSASTPVTAAVKDATVTIPIVMAHDPDPVDSGFVASFARPGGNITGLASFTPELSGKRLEILQEITARFARVAILGYSAEPGYVKVLREIESAAGAFKCRYKNWTFYIRRISSNWQPGRDCRRYMLGTNLWKVAP